MPSPMELYPLVVVWLQALGVTPHPTALVALADVVTALLAQQSLQPSAVMRALLSPMEVPARQRYKRVARSWDRPWLTSAWLTPSLVRAVLALVSMTPVALATASTVVGVAVPPSLLGALPGLPRHLALDSVRCGKWEVFTLGVVWYGRVLPVGWAVLPYPWPKGRFTPTVCALIRLVAAAWPADVRAHLVADRAFPSHAVLQTLRTVRWGCCRRCACRRDTGSRSVRRHQRGSGRGRCWPALWRVPGPRPSVRLAVASTPSRGTSSLGAGWWCCPPTW